MYAMNQHHGGSAFRYQRKRRTLMRLGASGAGIITSVAGSAPGAAAAVGTPIAVGATTGIASTALGVAIPIAGAALGLLIGGLLSAHFAREKGAQNENAALNQIVPAVQADIQSIVSAYNSGQVTASEAITALQQVQANYWQAVAPYEGGPGQAGNQSLCTSSPATGNPPAGPYIYGAPCNKSCTASCCVGCDWVNNYIDQLSKLLTAGKTGTFQLQGAIPGNKYGMQTFPALSVSLSTPAAGGSAGAAGGLSSVISSVTSGTVAGFPVWLLIVGGLGLWWATR